MTRHDTLPGEPGRLRLHAADRGVQQLPQPPDLRGVLLQRSQDVRETKQTREQAIKDGVRSELFKTFKPKTDL